MATLLAILALALIAVPDVRAAQRPNFVIVQTDDMALKMMNGKYLNERGREVPIMPNLRSLFGTRGTDFRNAYSPSPICGPSRAALLSGQLPHNNEVVGNGGRYGGWQGWRESPAMNPNLATVLDDAGYHTAHFGKWTNQYGEDPVLTPAEVPPGWDVWASDATDQSTRDFYGYFQLVRNEREGILDELRGPYGVQGYTGDFGIDPPWCDAFSRSELCNYHADRMNSLAVDEIRESADPFFVMVDHHGPHLDNSSPAGAQPATRHLDLAQDAVLPTPPNLDEKNTTDKDFLAQRSNGRLDRGRLATIRTIWRKSIESLQAIDEGIGQIHRALRETGKLSNTYFIFTADNGFFHGEHRFAWGKALPYEAAAKVPLAMAGPGIPARSERIPVSQLDIAPTVLDLADLGAGGMRFDGRSLTGLFEGLEVPERAVVIERLNAAEMEGDPGYPPQIPIEPLDPARPGTKAPNLFYRGIRIGDYKYFDLDSGGEELYDLRKDPYELYNQIRSPGYRQVLDFMRRALTGYRDCAGETCLSPPGTPPRPGVFLTDARRPAASFGSRKAYLYRQKVFVTVSCPTRSERACETGTHARLSGKRVTGKVTRTVAPGRSVRVVLPVLPASEIEILRLSERESRRLVIRTRNSEAPESRDRVVQLVQR